jgi:hypothetical protein
MQRHGSGLSKLPVKLEPFKRNMVMDLIFQVHASSWVARKFKGAWPADVARLSDWSSAEAQNTSHKVSKDTFPSHTLTLIVIISILSTSSIFAHHAGHNTTIIMLSIVKTNFVFTALYEPHLFDKPMLLPTIRLDRPQVDIYLIG